MKTIACGDLVPGCHFRTRADTEAELIHKFSAHVGEAHPDVTLSPALIASAKAKVRETSDA